VKKSRENEEEEEHDIQNFHLEESFWRQVEGSEATLSIQIMRSSSPTLPFDIKKNTILPFHNLKQI